MQTSETVAAGRPSAPTLPPEKRAQRAIGKRPRMSTFLRVLITVTALAHVPVAAAWAEIARALGFSSPRLLGCAMGVAGLCIFVGRAGAGMTDRRRPTWFLRLVDIPFFIHWCAGIFALIPSAVASLTIPWLGVPMRFYLGVYLLGLVVAGYGILIRRRWFRVG